MSAVDNEPVKSRQPGAWAALLTLLTTDHTGANGDLLAGADAGDPLKCRVAPDGPNCHAVWQAWRLTRDLAGVCRELEITEAQALQALDYYRQFPRPDNAEQQQWQRLGLHEMYKHNDSISGE